MSVLAQLVPQKRVVEPAMAMTMLTVMCYRKFTSATRTSTFPVTDGAAKAYLYAVPSAPRPLSTDTNLVSWYMNDAPLAPRFVYCQRTL